MRRLRGHKKAGSSLCQIRRLQAWNRRKWNSGPTLARDTRQSCSSSLVIPLTLRAPYFACSCYAHVLFDMLGSSGMASPNSTMLLTW